MFLLSYVAMEEEVNHIVATVAATVNGHFLLFTVVAQNYFYY